MNFGYSSAISTLGAWGVVAAVLAVVATVLAYIFIVPDKKREKLNPFCKLLHDTCNFKYLIVEKILQALYIFMTVYVIMTGFFLLFTVREVWYGERQWMGGVGILIMVLGPIVVRMAYELLMMAILLVKNVVGINNKLKNQNEGETQSNLFAAPDMSEVRQQVQAKMAKPAQPTQPAQPAARFCSRCGAALNPDGKCPHCDTPNQSQN